MAGTMIIIRFAEEPIYGSAISAAEVAGGSEAPEPSTVL
jgi:hypothetical protein